MYILSPFFILEFCLRKTLEVWNHGHPCPFMNVHPEYIFHPSSMADKIFTKKGSPYSELPFELPPEVCKSFVCFGHSVNFFLLFEGCSGVVVCIDQL